MNTVMKTITAGVLAASLGACSATVGTLPSVDVSNNITNVISQVIADTTAVCKFVPAANAVAAIIGTLTGISSGVDIATAATNAICGATRSVTVTPQMVHGRFGALRATPTVDLYVNGVLVSGYFVK